MTRTTMGLAACALSMIASGCYLSRTVGDGCEGGITLIDSGVPSDAAPTSDRGRPLDAPIRRDAGCGELVAPWDGDRCRPDTLDCLMSCADGECTDECLRSDPTCLECVQTTYVACANELGCQGPWDRVACCAREECPDGVSALECVTRGACAPEITTWSECSERFAERCNDRLGEQCFF